VLVCRMEVNTGIHVTPSKKIRNGHYCGAVGCLFLPFGA